MGVDLASVGVAVLKASMLDWEGRSAKYGVAKY